MGTEINRLIRNLKPVFDSL